VVGRVTMGVGAAVFPGGWDGSVYDGFRGWKFVE